MRSLNAIERLSDAGRPLLAGAEALVDSGEEEQILERIIASERAHVHRRGPIVIATALVATAVIGGAVAALVAHRHAAPVENVRGGHHHVALTGRRIRLAGYHFKTPAGFAASKESCMSTAGGGDAFAAAAAADGACVEAAFIVGADWLESHDPIPESATAVDVGDYSGYYLPANGSSDESRLYAALPHAYAQQVTYVLLVAHGVPEDELIAIAASGLPTLPPSVQGVTTTG